MYVAVRLSGKDSFRGFEPKPKRGLSGAGEALFDAGSGIGRFVCHPSAGFGLDVTGVVLMNWHGGKSQLWRLQDVSVQFRFSTVK